MIVIQCKSAFLPIEARYSGDCQSFFQGLNKQFGADAGAATEQLFRNLQFTFGLEGARRQIRDMSIDNVRKIYPLAIVQEPILGFWLAAKPLVEPFVKRVRGTLWRLDVEVRPVVFMTSEELERVVEYIRAGDFTLSDLLREKLGTDRDHQLSIEQFFNRVFLPSRSLKARRNEFLAGELERFKKAWLARLESGMYS